MMSLECQTIKRCLHKLTMNELCVIELNVKQELRIKRIAELKEIVPIADVTRTYLNKWDEDREKFNITIHMDNDIDPMSIDICNGRVEINLGGVKRLLMFKSLNGYDTCRIRRNNFYNPENTSLEEFLTMCNKLLQKFIHVQIIMIKSNKNEFDSRGWNSYNVENITAANVSVGVALNANPTVQF